LGRDAKLNITMRPAVKDALIQYCTTHGVGAAELLEDWIVERLPEDTTSEEVTPHSV
jgi:hypothetical protein